MRFLFVCLPVAAVCVHFFMVSLYCHGIGGRARNDHADDGLGLRGPNECAMDLRSDPLRLAQVATHTHTHGVIKNPIISSKQIILVSDW